MNWYELKCVINWPSLFMPASMHLASRQARHWLRCALSTGQLPRAQRDLQAYWRLFRIERCITHDTTCLLSSNINRFSKVFNLHTVYTICKYGDKIPPHLKHIITDLAVYKLSELQRLPKFNVQCVLRWLNFLAGI